MTFFAMKAKVSIITVMLVFSVFLNANAAFAYYQSGSLGCSPANTPCPGGTYSMQQCPNSALPLFCSQSWGYWVVDDVWLNSASQDSSSPTTVTAGQTFLLHVNSSGTTGVPVNFDIYIQYWDYELDRWEQYWDYRVNRWEPLTTKIGDVDGYGWVQFGVSGQQAGKFRIYVEAGANNVDDYDAVSQWYYFYAQPAVPLTVETNSLNYGVLGENYSFKLEASGGAEPYTWTADYRLVPWIYPLNEVTGLNCTSTGYINGIPNQIFNDTIVVHVHDRIGAVKNKALTLHLNQRFEFPNFAVPAKITVGTPINVPLVATGGMKPYTWVLNAITPSNIPLLIDSGFLRGTLSQPGYYQFDVDVFDALAQRLIRRKGINVYSIPTISDAYFPVGKPGQAYSVTINGNGGLPSYTWSHEGILAAGLSLSATTDGSYKLSGTPMPQSDGSYPFTVYLKDSLNATATPRNFTLYVYYDLAIATSSLPPVITGTSYNQKLTATGGNKNYQWSITRGNLPPGLVFDQTTGGISGAPTSAGTYDFTVQVRDTQITPATVSMDLSIAVYDPLEITSDAFKHGTAASFYLHQMLAKGGKLPFTWSIVSGTLPSGWRLDSASGLVSGTSTDVGTYNVTIQVADTQTPPATASQTHSFTLANGVLQWAGENETVEGCAASRIHETGSTTDLTSGALFHTQELFSTKGAAMGTAIELIYKSSPSYSGPLGPGWSHTYDASLTLTSDGSVVLRDGIGSSRLYKKLEEGSGFDSPPGDDTVLEKIGDSFTITYRDGLKKHFRGDGRIGSVSDRYENSISFSYTGSDLTGITDSSGRSTIIRYDQTRNPHRISAVEDPNGKTYDFSYEGQDCFNSLCKVTNPVADPVISLERGYWEFKYYPDNLLKSKRDPNGHLTQYTYDNSRLKTATDPEGLTRTIVYPSATDPQKITTLIEKDGGQWLFTYDTQSGVIKEKSDHAGNKTNYTYYEDGHLKSKTEPNKTDPNSGTIRLTTFYTYDRYGNLLTRTEPVDISSYIPAIVPETVDVAALANRTPPIKTAIRYSYDNDNYDRLTSISDERVTPFRTTSFAYSMEDDGEVVTATTVPGNFVTVTKKYPSGLVKEIKDANDKSTGFTYYPNDVDNRSAGTAGLLWTVTEPSGVVTTITSYDKGGNPLETTVKDTDGTVRLTLTQQIDALNRLERLTKIAGTLPTNVTQYGYDLVGNLTDMMDPEQSYDAQGKFIPLSSDASQKKTSYRYNYYGKVTKITDAKRNDTIFKYSGGEQNGVEKLVAVYDARVTKNTPLESQPHTGYKYNKLGRLENETDQLGKKLYYTYYDNGLVKEKYDASASTPGTLLVTYVYNNRGQVEKMDFSDKTYQHFTYKPDGKLEIAENQNIKYRYEYYDNGRLHTVKDETNNRTVSYDKYDALGQRIDVTVLKGAGDDERFISYEYDSANRPWHIKSPSHGTFTYLYDTLGRRDTLTYPNNTVADWDFDDFGRLTALTHKVVDGAAFASFNYTEYDRAANRKKMSGSKQASYDYDTLYRLQKATSAKTEEFDYDDAGNRRIGPSPVDTGYEHNSANQMTKGRKLGYLYDNGGNQIDKTIAGATDKTWKQTWNLQNQLVQVEKVKGSEKRTVSFTYDPLGRRIGKRMTIVVDGSTKTQKWVYVYDGDNIAVEFYTDENNNETKTFYTHGLGVDEHLAFERDGKSYYYHADGLGSIASITDATQAIEQKYEYDSHGMVSSGKSLRNSYTYTGREWDKETGLYYYRARYYDPMEGRFISKDPISFAGGDVNLYGYVQNNPMNHTDPYGLFDWEKFFKYTDTIDGPYRSKLLEKLDKVEEWAIGKLLNKAGVPTPSLTGVVGKLGGAAFGAASFLLTSPSVLDDPYPDGKGGWIFPNSKPKVPCQEMGEK